MRRTDRLFDIIQVFRDGKLHKGEELAARMEVSLRTIYRDIDTLAASGLPITGERGVGYLMTGPVFLPPLNLTQGELEVLELGLALVQASFGQVLSAEAQQLGCKVRAVLPRPELLDPNRGSIGVHHSRFSQAERDRLDILRRAILTRTKLRFDYLSLQGQTSQRRVRPLGVQVWETVMTLTAWCEDRQDFRVFRLDRMAQARLTEDTFRPERGKTLADYLKAIPDAA